MPRRDYTPTGRKNLQKNALVISALLFASVHCNLFQIPYALFAGFVLSWIALATGSIIPCIILHFLNNVVSIVFMRYASLPHFYLIFFLTMGILALISAFFIFIGRKKYRESLYDIKADKCKVEFTLSTVMFVAMTLIIGVFNLWIQL